MTALGPRLAIAALLAAGTLLLTGCLGGGDGKHGVTSTDHTSAPRQEGPVEVHTVTYTSSFDGSRVTALVAIPRGATSRGCVIAQFGLGSTKEDSSRAWQPFASLGLTTVSIDFRDHGARGSGPAGLEQAVRNPNSIAELIRGTVADLRGAIDYLENQPYCGRNIAYAGVSLGGGIGTILAATDRRVKAAVLIATPGTFRATLTTPGVPILPGITHHPARLRAALRILSPLNPARFVGRISPRPVLILSGREDKAVVLSNARVLEAAAREPKTILEYRGGHDPGAGPAASKNGEAIVSFLLRYLVEPTYGMSGKDGA
jgi:pimeloyl-ACP methyl ester carboxylesterase